MAKRGGKNLIGAWAFLIGVILAIVIGLFSSYLGASAYSIILKILLVIGILVGLLNITSSESSKFLLAAFALVIVSFMGQSVMAIIPQIGAILNALLVVFVPATIIVALKSLFELSKN
ncbi:MAG: hypothetical protein WC438_00935 [Candidatus Pacearchaeota archaeon]